MTLALKRVVLPLAVGFLSFASNAEASSFRQHLDQPPSQITRVNSLSRIEAALLDQVGCRRPPQAGVAMTAMLEGHLIAETNDGGDGIVLFVPVEPMRLLGFEIVRLSGWEPNPSGGAMPPFSRGPGTSPGNHISITVRGTEQQVRSAIREAGLVEATYVPDYSSPAWANSDGEVFRPRRLVPGPQIEAGDQYLASRPESGVVTLTCSASEIDFQRQIEADFRGWR